LVGYAKPDSAIYDPPMPSWPVNINLPERRWNMAQDSPASNAKARRNFEHD
jgi:hypothetical protein